MIVRKKPFGGDEGLCLESRWKHVVYVTKKKIWKGLCRKYQHDLYEYDVEDRRDEKLTEGRMGYDVDPAFSKDGTTGLV
jgi:Tol biopolymer transport system component